ncbi:hypothetical protein ACM55G_10460 [Flavobacterium sp. LB3P122]
MEPHRIKTKKKEEWIQKDIESKIPKLNRKTLFLPSQDELFF